MGESAPTVLLRRSHTKWRATGCLAAASLPLSAGVFIAWHHPLWPEGATAIFALWAAVATFRRGAWLLVLPAALPLLSFSPWTGWMIFDEFDLLVLGALAGGFARIAVERATSPFATGRPVALVSARNWIFPAAAFLVLGVAGFWRGVVDAGGWSFSWFDGYADAANSLRLSKSLLYAAAACPLLSREFRDSPSAAMRRFALGMQIGLACVGLALLWERAAYPGLLDFSSRYRTTAMFWEMHVGGAAIDAYLAMATPFAAWALVHARSRRTWAAAAALALLTGHACLTSFSRGAYAGILIPLLFLGGAWWLHRLRSQARAAALSAAWSILLTLGAATLLTVALRWSGYGGAALVLLALSAVILAVGWRSRTLPWRRTAAMALALALITEAVAVIGGGSFMRSRLDASEGDLGARVAHWRHGIELLKTPTDWLVGIGSGRLPTHYARDVPRGEFSGALEWVAIAPGRGAARLSGPATVGDLAGFFAMTQRVPLHPGGSHLLTLEVRTVHPVELAVDVCEQHLLYWRNCQGALLSIQPLDGSWQSISTMLSGPDLDPGPWYLPRLGVMSLTVRNVGGVVDMRSLSLTAPQGTELLRNRTLSTDLAQWLPSAQAHFLPWHIDNLYLELLIEHGMLGLLAFLTLGACALSRTVAPPQARMAIAPFLAASVLGALIVGSVSSILDVPRVAFLLFLLMIASAGTRRRSPEWPPSVHSPAIRGAARAHRDP